MKITFLGTGTSQGIPVVGCECNVCQSPNSKDKRLRCSILIEDAGKNFVVDTGPDFRQQMLTANVDDLEAVLMTHEHMDHISGLDDVRPFNFRHRKNMPIYATERVQKAIKRVYKYIFDPNPYPGIPRIEIHTISKQSDFTIANTTFTPIEVMHHKMPVLGFRVKDFTYITDAKTISKEEKEKIKGTKVLVLNALRKKVHISHLNLEEAVEWVKELEPEQAYFTHCSHLLGTHNDINHELPENIQLAYDGLQIELP